MAHVPHLFLERPWPDDRIGLDSQHRAHLEKVLRRGEGDAVTYTDGLGTVGQGTLESGSVLRGSESMSVRAQPELTIAAAVPSSKERARFLVEKLAEVGTARVVWLTTEFGRERSPRSDRARSWAVSALEQSRGAWLMDVASGSVSVAELEGEVWFADQSGQVPPSLPEKVTLAIGPEGGWSDAEIPPGVPIVTLSERVLRLETAAVVGAALIISQKRREFGHSEWYGDPNRIGQ